MAFIVLLLLVTGLGSNAKGEQAPVQRPKPTLVEPAQQQRTGTDGFVVKNQNLDVPTYRRQENTGYAEAGGNVQGATASVSDEDYLDIPAFLRMQAN